MVKRNDNKEMKRTEFKVSGKTYEFKPVTLEGYYVLQDLLKDPQPGDEYRIVSVITECPVESLKKLKMPDWIVIWDQTQLEIEWLLKPDAEIAREINFEGVKYSLPAIEDMTIGEFADLEILYSQPNIERRLEEIAAILYRPVISAEGKPVEIEEYDSKSSAERAKIFLKLPVGTIKSINVFFSQYVKSSIKNTLESLVQMPEMMMLPIDQQQALKNLLLQESGGELSIPLLEKTLSNFQKQRHLVYEVALTGSHGKSTKLKDRISRFKKRIRDKALEIAYKKTIKAQTKK